MRDRGRGFDSRRLHCCDFEGFTVSADHADRHAARGGDRPKPLANALLPLSAWPQPLAEYSPKPRSRVYGRLHSVV